MATELFGEEVEATFRRVREAALGGETKTVQVGGQSKTLPYPFPSPGDWRDCWVYFLMLDRFDNPSAPPAGAWDRRFDFRQGGTFNGVRRRLDYIAALGARAVWLSPVLKNSRPDSWRYNYHGYGIQDFLNVDERFASDGTRETAERELAALVEEAHARGLYVVLDIVLNHASRVFDYVRGGQTVEEFGDASVMSAPLGQEPPVRWLNGFGQPREDWEDELPAPSSLSPDDAVWPRDLQRREFFRRRGTKLTDFAPPGGFARGDFGSMRQLVAEYDAQASGEQDLRERYGRQPVLSMLIRAHQYLIARYDVDGFRIDTVKYVAPDAVQTFGNAVREFALSVGKQNFFTFGEVYDNEQTIANFVGRNSTEVEGFGIDAALDFPLFYKLPRAAKGQEGVEAVREVFRERKRAVEGLISSHGEAGRFFVSFLDNHDQKERFNHPQTPPAQVTLGLAALFCLQGIPCLYYGTEQGLDGTRDAQGRPDLGSMESVREALWGKPGAFDQNHPLYRQIQSLSRVRRDEPALRYGRIYFREVSGNGRDFGQPSGAGGVLAFSRVLNEREVLLAANTGPSTFEGFVLVDRDLRRSSQRRRVAYSNLGTQGAGDVRVIPDARFHQEGAVSTGAAAALFVRLAPSEAQIIVPA